MFLYTRHNNQHYCNIALDTSMKILILFSAVFHNYTVKLTLQITYLILLFYLLGFSVELGNLLTAALYCSGVTRLRLKYTVYSDLIDSICLILVLGFSVSVMNIVTIWKDHKRPTKYIQQIKVAQIRVLKIFSQNSMICKKKN